jgi:spore coat polysaccharide biosynthesis protein SpsF
MPRTIAIVQGRMSSSRLPGKVLLDLAGAPMLARVVERTRRSECLDGFVVATTKDASDDPVEAYCRQQGYPVFRGDMFDVLDRFYQAARLAKAEVVVRITADCPAIDPAVIARTVSAFLESGADLAANRLPPPWPRTFPIGLDTEVVSFAALERAWKEADRKFQREHVLPYLYEGVEFDPLPAPTGVEGFFTLQGATPRGFKIAQLHHTPDYGALRWTVDTPADLEMVRQVHTHLDNPLDFSWREVLAVFERYPELAEINAQVVHKTAFDID